MTKEKVPSFEREKIVKVRLGMRLRRLFWPLDVNVIGEILKKLGYRDIELSDGQVYNAQKSDVTFYSDQSRQVFGFNARNVEKLISSQKEFFALAEKDYQTNLADFVRFYELEYAVNYYSEKNTHDVIKNLYKDSTQISEFEKISEHSIIPGSLNLVSKNNPVQGEQYYQLVIEPKIEAANNVYFCRVLYRDNALQTLYNYAKKCSNIIQKSIDQLERQ